MAIAISIFNEQQIKSKGDGCNLNNGKSFQKKLEKVLFLEVDENKLENIFKVTIKEKVYLPINADEIIKRS